MTASTEALHSAGSAEWFSPPSVTEPARAVLGGIDLDPASCRVAQSRIQARRFFTAADDGLSKDWAAGVCSIFLNPPTPPKAWWLKLMQTTCETSMRAVYVAYSVEQLQQSQVWARAGLPAMTDRVFSICFPETRIPYLRRAADALAARLGQRKKLQKAGASIPKVLAREIHELTGMHADTLLAGDQPAHSSAIIGVGIPRADFRRAFKALGECR